MPQLWTSANQAVAFGSFCLMRMSTAAWKSLAKTLGFPTFTTGLVIAMQYDHDIHTKNYKGWLRQEEKDAKPPKRRRRARSASAIARSRNSGQIGKNVSAELTTN